MVQDSQRADKFTEAPPHRNRHMKTHDLQDVGDDSDAPEDTNTVGHNSPDSCSISFHCWTELWYIHAHLQLEEDPPQQQLRTTNWTISRVWLILNTTTTPLLNNNTTTLALSSKQLQPCMNKIGLFVNASKQNTWKNEKISCSHLSLNWNYWWCECDHH